MKTLKTVALFLGVISTLFVAIGFFLPRDWEVKVAVLAPASSKEMVFDYLYDLKKWDEWAIWRELDDSYVSYFSDPSSGVGAWQRWEGPKTGRGQIWLTSANISKGIEYEGAIESKERNNHGAISYELNAQDELEITWEDKGTLPPIVGGYFRSMVEASLKEHFRKSLERLAQVSTDPITDQK